MMSETKVVIAKKTEERKRVVTKRGPLSGQIPTEITENTYLNAKIKATLPENYNFEIYKSLWRIRSSNYKRVVLQFPEGLFVFAISIADLIEEFTDCEVVIMGDVTYGACCIDDITSAALKCDFIIHYGHSCLIPVQKMKNEIKVLYVFVDIKFDIFHFIQTIETNFESKKHTFAFGGTIQFISSVHVAAKELRKKNYSIWIPQSKPLSPGEVLGCTAPKLPTTVDVLVFVADGRFHLEALMIANPMVETFKYNPYNKEITKEYYDFKKMVCLRENEIFKSRKAISSGGIFGLILGTLGRQGNPSVFANLRKKLETSNLMILNVLLPEIKPDVLEMFKRIDVFVQVACPR